MRGLMRDGDQSVLDLFAGVPWQGYSPRGLTRVRILLSLRREPGGHEVEPDPMQLLLGLVAAAPKATRKRCPAPEDGAPLLLPSRRGRRKPTGPGGRVRRVRGDWDAW